MVADMRTILVKAGQGLRVYFPLSVVAAAGRRTRILEGDEVLEVDPSDRFVRRRMQIGDLIVVKQEQLPFEAAKRKPKSQTLAEE
jgi:hypothetical protein